MAKATFVSKVEEALSKAFPGSHIVIEPAYAGNYSVKIVGAKFNGKSEREKQDLVWSKVKKALKDESQKIRWIIVYGNDEL